MAHPKVRRAENKAHRAAWNHAVAQFRYIPPSALAEPQPKLARLLESPRPLPGVIHLVVLGEREVPLTVLRNDMGGATPVIHRRSREVETPTCLGALADGIAS